MLVTVNGLVIGRRTAGDSNCYLDILTAEFGVIEVFAHSVKKFKSNNFGSAALFSYSAFCLNKKGLSYTINSAAPKYNFHRISSDFAALSLGAYFAEIIKYSLPPEQFDGNILELFLITLYELEKKRIPFLLIKSIFELRISTLLGFMPDLRACAGCACYEHDELYFLIEGGNFFCGDCYNDRDLFASTSFLLNNTHLRAMRFAVYSPLKRIYKFTANEVYIKELSVISEKYLLTHGDRNFKTLDYFKNHSEQALNE